MTTTIINTGAPHFSSLMKRYRQSDYNIYKIINEFVDNAIKKTTKINIITQIDDTHRLQELCVSDNIETGFENIEQTGNNNPFNMGHINISHNDDSKTSEFGVGMKAGALSAANQLNVYSRVIGADRKYRYIEVICDFIRMSNEPDVHASYNPKIREITCDEYLDNHPFTCGSTIKLLKIRDGIYPKTTKAKITEDICSGLKMTYSRYISKGLCISVNNNIVEPMYDYFTDSKCVPFIINRDIFILEHTVGERQYIARQTISKHIMSAYCLQDLINNVITWYKYSTNDNKWISITNQNEVGDLIKSGYSSVYSTMNDENVSLKMRTVFTYFSDKLHTKDGLPIETESPPNDAMYIYKDDRKYGNQSLFKQCDNIHNYTLSEMEFISKQIGKEIGITFNKEIRMKDKKNELILLIKSTFADMRRNISSRRTSAAYTIALNKAIKYGIVDMYKSDKWKLPYTDPYTQNVEIVILSNKEETQNTQLNSPTGGKGGCNQKVDINKWFNVDNKSPRLHSQTPTLAPSLKSNSGVPTTSYDGTPSPDNLANPPNPSFVPSAKQEQGLSEVESVNVLTTPYISPYGGHSKDDGQDILKSYAKNAVFKAIGELPVVSLPIDNNSFLNNPLSICNVRLDDNTDLIDSSKVINISPSVSLITRISNIIGKLTNLMRMDVPLMEELIANIENILSSINDKTQEPVLFTK
jgi:hypothetical protein